ncbi:MAG: hypothetical protein AAGD32_02610 [Planctomycetota bacterium]
MKCLLFIPLVLACIWDNDTLKEEQRGLPEVAALIEGRFEKHSDFYYEQRLTTPRETLDDLDNHAVALEKLGRIDEAIALLEPVTAEHPSRYTTHANLGTFFIHRWLRDKNVSDLDRGIELIERAIEINPDAHFGREKYQLQLAQHVRAAVGGDEFAAGTSFVTPLVLGERLDNLRHPFGDDANREPGDPTLVESVHESMNMYVRVSSNWQGNASPDPEIEAAIEGVAGMIRFGTGTSPHLYEALGDLLAKRGDRRLAAHAYLRAIEFGHPDQSRINEAIDRVTGVIQQHMREEIARQAVLDRQAADAWVAAFQAFEDQLLRDGVPLTDAAYAPFYAEYGNPRTPPPKTYDEYISRAWLRAGVIGFLLFLGGFVVIFTVRRLLRVA